MTAQETNSDIASIATAWSDPALVEIAGLSLLVSLSAVALASCLALPAGAALAVARFPGRRALILAINTLMAIPSVVVGLVVYLMLSGRGPLGALQLLYTPTAMIIAQVILVVPLITAMSRQAVKDLNSTYDEQLRAFGLSAFQRAQTLLYEGRSTLASVVLAAFGRAIAEVGAVMIVGGNINHVSRTMTTAIALETSRGNLALALRLGAVLLVLALLVNAVVLFLRPSGGRLSAFGIRRGV